LVTLGIIARDRRVMGPMAIRWRKQVGLAGIAAAFLSLTVLAFAVH
jgi:hypothetical protein